MNAVCEQSMYGQFPWAKPVMPDIDPTQGFYDLIPWTFNEAQFNLIKGMFAEIENWFVSRSLPVEMAIFEVRSIFNRLQVDLFCSHSEIYLIVNKYIERSEEVF